MEPGSSWWCAVKGQEAHFAAGESPTRHKGKREKKCVSSENNQTLEKAVQNFHSGTCSRPSTTCLPSQPCFDQRTRLRPPEIPSNLGHPATQCSTQKMKVELSTWKSFKCSKQILIPFVRLTV